MSLTPDQLARRLEGIAATDVASIIGCNPYRSVIDVWRAKRGEHVAWTDTERTKWGDLLEPVIRADFAQRRNVRIEVPGTLVHPDAEWMLASPDGIQYPIGSAEPIAGYEIKCHTIRLAHMYGAPGTDEVPPYELVQCSWNMAVSGLDRWDLTAFIDGQTTDYIIDRDEELLDMLRERAERFLVDCVRGGAVPEPDGTEGFDAWLKARHEKNSDVLLDIWDDNETFTLIERAKEVREQGKMLDDEHAKIVQALKLKIGEAAGLTWKNAKGKVEKVTWKRSKATRRVDIGGMRNDDRNLASLTLSARNPELERAIVCLESLGATTPIGHSSRAAITAGEVVDAIRVVRDTIDTIARRDEAAYTTAIPGKRPFCFPKGWAAPRMDGE